MHENDYIKLIYKELSGNLNSEERSILDDWKSQEANSQKYDEVVETWKMTGDYQKVFNLDLEKEYEGLRSKMQGQIVKKKRIRIRRQLMIAASLVLLASLSIWLFYPNEDSKWHIAEANDLVPVQFDDGSKVWVHEGSSIKYMSNKTERPDQIELNGEAFFEIRKNISNPIVITGKVGSVKILGTRFHLLSYPDSMKVQLLEGRLKVESNFDSLSHEITPGKSAVIPAADKIKILNDVEENAFYWRSKTLVFNYVKMNEVIKDLESSFGVDIIVEEDKLLGCKLNATFYDKNIQEILNTISRVFAADISIEKNSTFIISNGACE